MKTLLKLVYFQTPILKTNTSFILAHFNISFIFICNLLEDKRCLCKKKDMNQSNDKEEKVQKEDIDERDEEVERAEDIETDEEIES